MCLFDDIPRSAVVAAACQASRRLRRGSVPRLPIAAAARSRARAMLACSRAAVLCAYNATERVEATSTAAARTAAMTRSRVAARRSRVRSRCARTVSSAARWSRAAKLAWTRERSDASRRRSVLDDQPANSPSRLPVRRKSGSRPERLPVGRGSGEAAPHGQVVAGFADPAREPGPPAEERVVRDLHRGRPGHRVTIEGEEPTAAELVQHPIDGGVVDPERAELGPRHPPSGWLPSLARRRQPQEELAGNLPALAVQPLPGLLGTTPERPRDASQRCIGRPGEPRVVPSLEELRQGELEQGQRRGLGSDVRDDLRGQPWLQRDADAAGGSRDGAFQLVPGEGCHQLGADPDPVAQAGDAEGHGQVVGAKGRDDHERVSGSASAASSSWRKRAAWGSPATVNSSSSWSMTRSSVPAPSAASVTGPAPSPSGRPAPPATRQGPSGGPATPRAVRQRAARRVAHPGASRRSPSAPIQQRRRPGSPGRGRPGRRLTCRCRSGQPPAGDGSRERPRRRAPPAGRPGPPGRRSRRYPARRRAAGP